MMEHQRYLACSDEIDLVELLRILVSGKWIVISIVFIFTLSAVLYYMLAPKVYKLEARLGPIKDISSVYRDDTQAKPSRRSEKFLTFLEYLGAVNTQNEFMASRKISSEDFGTLNLRYPKKTDETARISLLSKNKNNAADLLNAYIKFADQSTIRALVANFKQLLQKRRKMLRLAREAQVIRLQEALAIAAKLDTATMPSDKKDSFARRYENVVTDEPGAPLYMRGSPALKAEIEILKVRKNDDAFDELASELKAEINVLQTSEKKQTSRLQTAILKSKVETSHDPVKPKPVFILFALIGGLIVGVLCVFFITVLDRIRK